MEKALIIFSGGQDSTTCLIQAIAKYGKENVEVISFLYGQRHQIELDCAAYIANYFGVKRTVMDLSILGSITHNTLMTEGEEITIRNDGLPSTVVDGRNALFLLYAAIYAKSQDIHRIVIGVCETDFSGYPDCRDVFVKSMNVSLNLAMNYDFVIDTPLMWLTKCETWALADELGYFEFVRNNTHTCYNGVKGGCGECPSCKLREKGLQEYLSIRNKH